MKSCRDGGIGLVIEAPAAFGKEHGESAFLGFSYASTIVLCKIYDGE